jgi:hypothetical protein
MNKNLKKAISTVAALALTASSIGVVSAATKFSDTQGTTYESAINELSALGIIDGYEDGTFKPDEGVNRAAFAKLVVGVMNKLAIAEANSTVIFDDVKAGSYDWAIGYVAQAYQDKLVNGTNDAGTTFDPGKGVTYAEAMKMLVCAAGYEEWSVNAGGWPNGYLQYANNIGIGNGVTGVSNDTALTRGQCAQMIANTLTAALCEVTGYTTDNGVQVAERQQQDGTGSKPFKSLLTENWDAFEVNGHVSGTHESGATDAGKVNYVIQKTKNYDDSSVVKTLNDDPYSISNVYDDTNEASSTINQYTKAIIKIDDTTDEDHILYIEVAGRNVEQEFDANNFATLNFTYGTEGTIEIYKSSSSSTTTSYKLASNAKMIVNNVEVDLTAENCEKYLANNADIKATLIDTPANGGSTDGKYDYVVVEYAAIAVVDEVTEKTNEYRVNFDNYDATAIDKAYLSVETDDDDKVYTFVYDGNEIDVTELQQYDVLALVFDPSSDLNSSNYVKATVTRNVVEGTCTSNGTDSDGDDYYTVNGTDYYMSNAIAGDSLDLSYTYTLYLDKNGDIAKYEENQASVNYAIVDRFYTNAGDDMVRLITKTGNKTAYVLKEDKTGLSDKMGKDSAVTDEKFPIENRIVDYSVNSSGEATLKSVVNATRSDNATYKSSTTRIGSTYVSDSNIILNASNYATNTTESVTVESLSYFINEMEYDVVFAGKRSSSDNSYPFVVIITGNEGYTVETQMAIYKSSGSTQDDGQDKKVINVYVNGENADTSDGTTAVLCEDTVSLSGLTEGDAIVYKKNSDGYVDEIVRVTEDSTQTIANNRSVLAKAVNNASKYPYDSDMISDAVKAINFKGDGDVSFVFGPVIDKKSNAVIVADTVSNNYTSDDAGKSYSYDDAKFYQYNGEGRNGNYISVITASAVAKSTVPNSGYADKTQGIINWNSDANTVNYVVLRLVDDDVKDVLSITENNNPTLASAKVVATAAPTATPEATVAPTEDPGSVATAVVTAEDVD